MVTSSEIDASIKDNVASSSSPKDSTKQKFLALLLLILLTAVPTYGLLCLNKTKFVRSEISQAEQAREMIMRNDWITPSYHYIPNIDKPAMIFWMVIPAFKTLGEHPYAARLQAFLAALATLTVLAFALRRSFDWKSALLGTMVLATASRFLEFTSLVMVDMLLTFFDLVMLVALYATTVDEKRRGRWFALAAVFCGLAVMTKGPVGLVLPGACFGLYLFLTRQLKVILDKRILVAVPCFLAVAAPWYIAVAATMKGPSSVVDWLWHHNVERFFGETYAWTHPPQYMVESFFMGFAPWSVLVPFVLAASIKKWRSKENPAQSRCELFMWLWVGLTILFYTLSKGKMNYYDLPCFPAAAGLVGVYLTKWIDGKARTARVFAGMLSVALVALGVVACVIVPHITGDAIKNWALVPLALFVPTAYVIYSLVRGNLYRAYATAGMSIMLAVLAFSIQVLPALSREMPAVDYLYKVRFDPKDYKLAMDSKFAITIDWVDHGVFITGKIPDVLSDSKQMSDFLNQKDRVYLILPEDRFNELPESVREHVTVLQRRPYMSDKMTLPFLLKCHGNLCGKVPLLLVTNDASVK